MDILYKIPSWFSGYDSLFQILFAIIALFVSGYAYKIYKVSKRKEIKLFSIAFLLISLSYMAWPLITLFASFPVGKETLAIMIEKSNIAGTLAIIFHVTFFLMGLLTLVYMNLKEKNRRTYALLAVLILLIAIIGLDKTYIIYITSSILIFFILYHHLKEYRQKRNTKMLPVTLAFGFLFLGSLDLIFADTQNLYYVGGHLFMLIAYILILGRLIYIMKNVKKKR